MSELPSISVGIVLSQFETELSEVLLQGVLSALKEAEGGAATLEAVDVFRAPGAFEIPYIVMMKALSKRYEVLMGLGVVLAGQTDHHEVIANSTARSFQEIMLRTGCPILNGIVVAKDLETARARCVGEQSRSGHLARAALEMGRQFIDCHRHLQSAKEGSCCGGGGCCS